MDDDFRIEIPGLTVVKAETNCWQHIICKNNENLNIQILNSKPMDEQKKTNWLAGDEPIKSKKFRTGRNVYKNLG